MTANQIAAASERENERHNAATEQEAVRHDKELESISNRQTDLQEEANQITANYNNNMVALKKKRDEAEIELAKADAEHKWIYQETVNTINQQMADADSMYKIAMADNATVMQGIEQQRADEINRHNEAKEQLDQQHLDFEKIKLDYQAHQWDTENALAASRNEISRRAMENDWYFNQRNFQVQSTKNRIAEQQLAFDMSKWNDVRSLTLDNMTFQNNLLQAQAKREKSTTVRNYYGLATDTVDTGIRAFKAIVPDFNLNLGGATNGTQTSKQAFENLFQ